MKKTLTVCKLCLRLLLRSGSIKGLALILLAICLFAFFSTKHNGVLTEEVKVRVLYSFSISYTFLSIAIIALTCFTIRRQIDSRNIHQLCSLPLSRLNIWLGQAMALFSVAISLLTILYLSLMGSTYFYQKDFTLEERQTLYQNAKSPTKEIKPEFLSDYDLIMKAVNERGGKLQAGMPPEIWNAIHLKVISDAQNIPSQQSKTYEFDFGQRPQTEFFTFYFRPFFGGKKADFQIDILPEKNAPANFTLEDTSSQARKTYLQIPNSYLPTNGRFYIKLTNLHTGTVKVQRSNGIHCSYSNSNLQSNLFKAFISHTIHLAVFILLGMTCGTALTFATATFTSFALFLISLSYSFFENIAKDMLFVYEPPMSTIVASKTIETLLWIVKGLQAPPVIENLAYSRLIENSVLWGTWLPATIIYAAIITIIGSYLFNKKELSILEV
jgi:hypothetical protein